MQEAANSSSSRCKPARPHDPRATPQSGITCMMVHMLWARSQKSSGNRHVDTTRVARSRNALCRRRCCGRHEQATQERRTLEARCILALHPTFLHNMAASTVPPCRVATRTCWPSDARQLKMQHSLSLFSPDLSPSTPRCLDLSMSCPRKKKSKPVPDQVRRGTTCPTTRSISALQAPHHPNNHQPNKPHDLRDPGST